MKYRNEGGIILALHDIAFENLYQIFAPFYKQVIGYKDKRAINIDGLKFYKKVSFNKSSNKNEIMSSPFKINDSFDVAETHFTLVLDPKYIVVQNEDKNQHYYAENLEENFADLAMCHTIPISHDEEKFFYNAVCHLCKYCRNHIPSKYEYHK